MNKISYPASSCYLNLLIRSLIAISIFIGSIFFALIIFFIADYAYSNLRPIDKTGGTSLMLFKDQGWYELKPNQKLQEQWGKSTFEVITDQLGFRTGPNQPKSGKADIIFLGDSFTFGMNPWEESFVGLFDNDSKLKIINAGVVSYSPTAYLYTYQKALKTEALKKEHIVVIGLDLSDVQDEAAYYLTGLTHPIKRQFWGKAYQDPNTNFFISMQKFLQNNMRLTYRIFMLVANSPFINPPENVFITTRSAFTWEDWNVLNQKPGEEYTPFGRKHYVGYAPLGVAGGLKKINQNIAELVKLAKKNNSKVYLLIYPWPAQIKFAQKFNWSNYAKNLCLETHCDGVIDATPIFIDYAQKNPNWYFHLYTAGDVHFNRNGNQIISNELKKKLSHE